MSALRAFVGLVALCLVAAFVLAASLVLIAEWLNG